MEERPPGSGRYPRIVVLQIDCRRPPEGRPDASKPRRVDRGVGGGRWHGLTVHEGRQRPPEGTNGSTTGTVDATNMRRSAYRAAISAGPSTDSVDNTIPSHRVHLFIQPGCTLPSLWRFLWLFVVFVSDLWILRIICLPTSLTESYADRSS